MNTHRNNKKASNWSNFYFYCRVIFAKKNPFDNEEKNENENILKILWKIIEKLHYYYQKIIEK